MVTELHAGIRRLIHEKGDINPLEVEVRFEPPTRELVDRLVRPAIDFFLFEIGENTDLRRNDFQSTSANGRSERRLPPRRVDLHYMVSALTTEVDDEHLLLWRALATLMKYHEIPAELLPDAIQRTETPVVTRTAQPEDMSRVGELWTGLGVEPHPSIAYVVTVPLDLEVVVEAPLVLTRTTRYTRQHADAALETGHHIGGVLRKASGEPLEGARVAIDGRASDGSVTGPSGQFVLTKVPAGSVPLRVTPLEGDAKTVTVEVPGDSYDIVVDD